MYTALGSLIGTLFLSFLKIHSIIIEIPIIINVSTGNINLYNPETEMINNSIPKFTFTAVNGYAGIKQRIPNISDITDNVKTITEEIISRISSEIFMIDIFSCQICYFLGFK